MENTQNITQCLWKFIEGDWTVNEFEQWVYTQYAHNTVEDILGSRLYQDILECNYRDKHVVYRLKERLTIFLCHLEKHQSPFAITIKTNTYRTEDGRTPIYPIVPGNTYEVICIDISPEKHPSERLHFRIVSGEEDVSWIPLVLVDAIHRNGREISRDKYTQLSNDIPDGFSCETLSAHNVTTIAPQELSHAMYQGTFSFWEDFYGSSVDYDGSIELRAIDLLKKVLRRLSSQSYLCYIGLSS